MGRGGGAVSSWDPGIQISEEPHSLAREGGPCGLPRPLGCGRARAPPRASVTRLLLRTLGAPLHLESPGPFVSAGNRPFKMGMGHMSRCGTQSSALDDCRPDWLWVLNGNSHLLLTTPKQKTLLPLFPNTSRVHGSASCALGHVGGQRWSGCDASQAASLRVLLLGCPK